MFFVLGEVWIKFEKIQLNLKNLSKLIYKLHDFPFLNNYFFLEITIKNKKFPFNKKRPKKIIQKNLLFD
jgi:hypothetical protein